MFQCKDLFTLSSLSKLKLLAGSGGLHKGIRWVYKAESLQLSQWVHGGELLIISKPVISNSDFNLLEILKESIRLNMSGALLLVGPDYIEKIFKSTIRLCDTHNFPLFAIPWDLPLVDFFEEIGHSIATSNFHQNRGDDVIFNIIFENDISPNLLNLKAMDANYSLNGTQRFFLLHFMLTDSERAAGMEQSTGSNIREYIHQTFLQSNSPVLLSNYGNHILGMLPNENISEITPIFQKLLSYLSNVYPQLSCNIGIGLPVSDIAQLKSSYEQAAQCITYCSKLHLEHQIVTYDQLGLYQLFSDLKQTECLELFVKNQIGLLSDYDEVNHTALIETLYCYLQNNCNLLHTANALYTHRNTVKYRLSRICEIAHLDLADASVRLNLHLALYLKKYIL